MKLLDVEGNDIYIHLDSKSKISEGRKQGIISSVSYSELMFLNPTNIKWGGYSIVKAELLLLKAAVQKGYDYYHLLSGQDLPLKMQDEIHAFFEKNAGYEFIDYHLSGAWLDRVKVRYQYYWLLPEHSRRKTSRLWDKVNRLNIFFQRLLRIDRLKNQRFAAGSQWFSITNRFAKYICDNEEQIENRFKHTFIPDEAFIASMAADFMNESKYNKEISPAIYPSNMRYIDWERGSPHVWEMTDYDKLMNSDFLFARKFDETVDLKVILEIYQNLIK